MGLQYWRWQKLFTAEGVALEQQAKLEEEQEALQIQILSNLPSLGFHNLLSDWAFLQYLQYFGNLEHRQITGYGLADDYFEAIIKYDPYYFEPYIFISSTMSLYAAQPQRGIELQRQGLASLTPKTPPNSYSIWRQIGIDELLFLGDHQAAIRSHEIAAEWASQSPAPRAERAEQSFKDTAEFLKANPQDPQVQANAWLQVVAAAQDDRTRRIAIEQIEAAGYELVPVDTGRFTVRPKDETPVGEP
ncbi:MAG: hypothetical protein ACFB0E_14225 [Leptolyngbyaceae cyanobacterium]